MASATITPFGGNSDYTISHEAACQTASGWFRTNKVYDWLIEFDAVVYDRVTQANLFSSCDSCDHRRLNSTGYQVMARAIHLKLFVL